MKTYYEILGVSEKATSKEIKNAYKSLMKKYHPDVYKGDDKIAAEINNAYDVLSNSKLKAEYDQELIEIRKSKNKSGYSYYNYTQATNSNNATSYRNESAQDIYNRIKKNKDYKEADYSNSYSYQTINKAQNYVQNKLTSLTNTQLSIVALVVISICLLGLTFTLFDMNNISKLKESRNTITSPQQTNTNYSPSYDRNNYNQNNMTSSVQNIMHQYGFDLYFDSVSDFYKFMYSSQNQDLYISVMGGEISTDEYFTELFKRAEEQYN